MSAVYILANYQIPPGNSIAAGHDCLYEQSYPVLLNETFGRLMEAAGVGYTAMNVAMGNTRVVPYSYCVDAHAGLDADIVTWSFVSIVYGILIVTVVLVVRGSFSDVSRLVSKELV